MRSIISWAQYVDHGIFALDRHWRNPYSREAPMFQSDPLAEAGAILFEKAEQRLAVLLGKHEAQHRGGLPRPLQFELAERALLETSATIAPTGNLEMLKHGFRSFSDPAFLDAMDRMVLSCKFPGDAMEMARGVYAAIVLAGLGLLVAPFDLERMRIMAKPTNDIDAVQALFATDKGAYVGYSSCEAPFYLLVTDCISTLRQLVTAHPALSEVRHLLARHATSLPPDPGQPFQHGMAFFRREAGDAISTIGLMDPDPMGGSVVFYAGWEEGDEPCGAPNEGYIPVPGQLLRAVVRDARAAYPFWWEPTSPALMN
jgi:hypothetical protein